MPENAPFAVQMLLGNGRGSLPVIELIVLHSYTGDCSLCTGCYYEGLVRQLSICFYQRALKE